MKTNNVNSKIETKASVCVDKMPIDKVEQQNIQPTEVKLVSNDNTLNIEHDPNKLLIDCTINSPQDIYDIEEQLQEQQKEESINFDDIGEEEKIDTLDDQSYYGQEDFLIQLFEDEKITEEEVKLYELHEKEEQDKEIQKLLDPSECVSEEKDILCVFDEASKTLDKIVKSSYWIEEDIKPIHVKRLFRHLISKKNEWRNRLYFSEKNKKMIKLNFDVIVQVAKSVIIKHKRLPVTIIYEVIKIIDSQIRMIFYHKIPYKKIEIEEFMINFIGDCDDSLILIKKILNYECRKNEILLELEVKIDDFFKEILFRKRFTLLEIKEIQEKLHNMNDGISLKKHIVDNFKNSEFANYNRRKEILKGVVKCNCTKYGLQRGNYIMINHVSINNSQDNGDDGEKILSYSLNTMETEYGHLMTLPDEKKKSFDQIFNLSDIVNKTINNIVYKPKNKEKLIMNGNMTSFNIYQDNRQRSAEKHSKKGLDIIAHVQAVMLILTSYENNYRNRHNNKAFQGLIYWLRRNYENPGNLIGVYMFIVGSGGIGKSYFMQNIVLAILGEGSITAISETEIKDPRFNQYVTNNSFINYCDESNFLMLASSIGRDNMIVMIERIKELANSPTISCNMKNTQQFIQENHHNYVYASNHDTNIKDICEDRRNFYIKSIITKDNVLNEVNELLKLFYDNGETSKLYKYEHINDFFAFINKETLFLYASEIVKWILDYELNSHYVSKYLRDTDEPVSQAIPTDAKKDLIKTSDDGLSDNARALKDILDKIESEKNKEYFLVVNERFIILSILKDYISQMRLVDLKDMPNIINLRDYGTTNQWTKALNELGYLGNSNTRIELGSDRKKDYVYSSDKLNHVISNKTELKNAIQSETFLHASECDSLGKKAEVFTLEEVLHFIDFKQHKK